MSALSLVAGHENALRIWIIDANGNVAISAAAFTLLAGITRLIVPIFGSTEEAVAWGSRLTAEEHIGVLDLQRSSSEAALREGNQQRKVDLATQSQLLREAAEAFVPRFAGEASFPVAAQAQRDWSSQP
jgi:hypothetical protein